MPTKSSRTKSNSKRKNPQDRRWSGRVTRESHALALEQDVFKLPTAEAIASSLKRSAEQSTQRKAAPFQSAMSMLNFYINRGGKNLSSERRKVLNDAKEELRKQFGRE